MNALAIFGVSALMSTVSSAAWANSMFGPGCGPSNGIARLLRWSRPTCSDSSG